jgi:geranylgeranyl pyrophosphate synthase
LNKADANENNKYVNNIRLYDEIMPTVEKKANLNRYNILRGPQTDLQTFKNEVEGEVRSTINSYISKLEGKEERERMTYYLDIESSFRRPVNLILTGMALGAEKKDLIKLASAIQLSQEFILMADDLIDKSKMRRGRESYVSKYGGENTVNDALMLLSVTWEMLVDYVNERRESLGDAQADAIRHKFYEIGSLTYYGESKDINMMNKVGSLAKISYEDCILMTNLKTSAYTVWGPMQLGALAAGADEKVLEAIREIGEPAGTAFQILDDIKDITATKEQLGKEPFSDIRESKPTIIILKVFERASSEEKQEIDAIFKKSSAEKTEKDIKRIVSLIEKYKGIEYAEQEVQKWTEIATERFVKYDSDPEFRSMIKSSKHLGWLLASIALI